MAFLLANTQTRWPDSFASSERVKLTLRCNAEEETSIITPSLAIVRAGFDAPTSAPTAALGTAGGSLASSTVYYRYVYASSKYPYVDNGGSIGTVNVPYSLPSAKSNGITVGSSATRVVVTVTKTTRSDVDLIWIFRSADTSATISSAEADAGEMYYVGSVSNDGLSGTTTFIDTVATNSEGELLQIDNYPAPTFWKTVFDGIRWWGWGNPIFEAEVTVNGTSGVTLTDDTLTKWWSGRNGQIASFEGIYTGGFDNRGRYYFKWTSLTTATMYADTALTIPANVNATGTTRIRIQGFASTLYKSKPYNPFAWGVEDQIRNDDGTIERIPRQYAFNVGNGKGTAIAVLSDARLLKLDTEDPARTYYLNLEQAGENGFETTLRQEDGQFSVGSHHSQFAASIQGQTILMGVDAKNFGILQSTAGGVGMISDPVQRTMRQVLQEGTYPNFYHGIFDPRTELNCWWVKTVPNVEAVPPSESSFEVFPVSTTTDTMVWMHGPTGTWGTKWDAGTSASASVFDPVEKESKILIGTDGGLLLQDLVEDVYYNGSPVLEVPVTISGVVQVFILKILGTYPLLDGVYFYLTDITGANGLVVMVDSTGVAPFPSLSGVIYQARASSGSITDVVAAINTVGNGFHATAQDASRFLLTTPYLSNPSTGTTTPVFYPSTTGNSVSGTYLQYIQASMLSVQEGWHVVTDDSGKPLGWIMIEGIENGNAVVSAQLSPFERPATFDARVTVSATKLYPSITPCVLRTYFSPNPKEESRRAIELWVTMDFESNHSIQFFPELSDTSSKTFALSQTKKQDGTSAMTWKTEAAMPSTLLTQFGLQFNEFGYQPFRFYNSVIKMSK